MARRNAAWSGPSTCCRTSLRLTCRSRPRRLSPPCTKHFLRDLSHRARASSAVTMAACVLTASLSRRRHAREEHAMRGADKVICQAAAVLLLLSISSAPAKAQFLGGGGAGGQDMMTQMAPMLEMMKAKMGKRRFAMLMQTMGPMMSRMMENGGGGLGPMVGGLGGLGGGNLGGGFGAPNYGGYTPMGGGGYMPT